MLQILRNKAQSIVIQAVVVIIALVFIFWGVGPNLMNSREAAIVVNDEEITFTDFQDAYDRTYNNLREQFGGTLPQGLAESLGIRNQVVNQLIQDALLRQGAADMGIVISQEEIRDTIESMVQFQENGAFSMDKYTSLLALNGYSPQKFEEKVERDMLAQKVQLNIAKFATTATQHEIEDLNRLENASVAIKYVKIDPDEYVEAVDTDLDKIKEWFTTVEENYKTTPQVKLKYLDFSYTTVGAKITVDESAIKSYYDEHLDEYTQGEKRGARHILFKADTSSSAEVHQQQRKKAEEVLAMAQGGQDFAALAKEYSEGPSKAQGGNLGLFSRGQMVKPFEEAVFALPLGGISDVVTTSFGYHIIKVEEIQPSVIKPFSEIQDEIKTALQNEEARPLAFQLANEAYEGIIAAGSLESFLEENPEITVRETDFFSRSDPPQAFSNDVTFLTTAFALKENELSSLIETDSGYAILYAVAVKQPQVPDFGTVTDQVSNDFKQFRAEELARQTAENLLQRLQEGEGTLKDLAEEEGLIVKNSSYLKKNSSENDGLPGGLVQAAFELSINKQYPDEPFSADTELFVYEFVDRKIPMGKLNEQESQRYRSAIIQRKQQQVLTSWLESRRNQAKVYTHQRLQSDV
ncbi:MAG: SurA N-terminal domain-containing protein [Desulfocapsaceae bacterium]|nr:SurA N-terminal domain-containing protein [Desulfocapsaceae bacterium]